MNYNHKTNLERVVQQISQLPILPCFRAGSVVLTKVMLSSNSVPLRYLLMKYFHVNH